MWGLVLVSLACRDPGEGPPPPRPPADGELTVSIAVRPGLRDLVATASSTEGHLDWSWTRDGEETLLDGPRVPATELWPGERWAVTVTFDGETASDEVTVPEPLGGNVLVVVLDDVGLDKLTMYGIAEGAPTPVLDGLADEGLRFTQAWAYPTCSPTRAATLTGRHPFRHGTGFLVDMGQSAYAHPLESVFLPAALNDARGAAWTSVAFGKWHLSGNLDPNQLQHPLAAGFARYAGSPGYLNEGAPQYQGYFVWRKNTDGVESVSEVYNTTDIVDDALATLPTLPGPWFCWLPFNAAHTPYHTPPAHLFTQALPAEPTGPDRFEAMLEAMDTELGRLLDGLPAEVLAQTTIVVIGDNGTSDLVAVAFDPTQAKGSIYEGGVRVPLIVVSPHAAEPGRVVDVPVMSVDLFPTVLDLAGVPLLDDGPGLALPMPSGPPRALDGLSWLPLLTEPGASLAREVSYTETIVPNGPPPWIIHRRAVSDGRFKLHRTIDGVDALWDLDDLDGLDQTTDLLQSSLSEPAEAAYQQLAAVLDGFGVEEQYEGF